MRFFEVAAKCGHVGRGRYYLGIFYVKAENGQVAAAKVRMKPRVKHDHKDAILAVSEIGYRRYKAGLAANRANPYFSCHNVQEQRLFFGEIAGDIYPEEDAAGIQYDWRIDRRARRDALSRYSRKEEKYGFNYYTGACAA